jgi:hypothetical protein
MVLTGTFCVVDVKAEKDNERRERERRFKLKEREREREILRETDISLISRQETFF